MAIAPSGKRGRTVIVICCKEKGRLETASTQTKATDPGFQTLNFSLVRAGDRGY
ncbi:hypothetical protein GXM_02262 [Nostoc sphaeroides CCNUC1]|uniref:Uncharacterized protein n=1 Tax=Nostoc sphaeroides CCNUC1 TaxID=2653204 RepID=A0A5P8VWQ6_9NOSO|nr:hypothetical protein GXM_02262 [Nostoc sphaeroides CCNUC1]